MRRKRSFILSPPLFSCCSKSAIISRLSSLVQRWRKAFSLYLRLWRCSFCSFLLRLLALQCSASFPLFCCFCCFSPRSSSFFRGALPSEFGHPNRGFPQVDSPAVSFVVWLEGRVKTSLPASPRLALSAHPPPEPVAPAQTYEAQTAVKTPPKDD